MKSMLQYRSVNSARYRAFASVACRGALFITLSWCVASVADSGKGLGYKSVEEARRVVTKLPRVTTKSIDGWFIVEDSGNKTIWTFPEKGEIGYPSVIRRRVVENDGKVEIETRVLCEAKEIACNELVQRFAALDKQTRERLANPQ